MVPSLGAWVDAWWNLEGNEDMPYKLANSGYKTVLPCVDYFYFDLAYEEGFDEPGDGWIGFLDVGKILSFMPYNYYAYSKFDIRGKRYASNYYANKETLLPSARNNIIGIKGALWGENLISDELTEYQLIPKMLALAEKCWSMPNWETEADSGARELSFQKTYAGFMKRLGETELPRLDYYHGGYKYRIPAPAVVAQNNQWWVNHEYRGFIIRYSTDGSKPNSGSPAYKKPLSTITKIKLGAFSKSGRGGNVVSAF